MEKKRQEGTLRQAPTTSHPFSSSAVHSFAQKKKIIVTCPIHRARTPSSASSSSSSSSSSSFSSDEPEAGVSRLMSPIICEKEKQEEEMTSN